MTYKKSLVLLLIMAFLVACGGGAAEESEPTAEPISEAPETVVVEDDGEDVEELAVSEPTPEPVEEEPTTEPTEEPAPEPTEEPIEEPAVAELLTLTDVARGDTVSDNFIQRGIMTWESVDTAGEPITVGMEVEAVTQNVPELAFSSSMAFISNGESGGVMEAAVIGSQYYFFSADNGGCITTSADQITETLVGDFFEETDFQGDVELIETGVEVNGIMSDRYALDVDDFKNSIAADSDTVDFIEGSIYIARDGGYITRVYIQGEDFPEAGFGNLNPEEKALMTMQIDLIPVDETLTIEIPTGCVEQLANAPTFPMMDDAAKVTTLGKETFYESSYSLEEVLTFYRETMEADGWMLSNESVIASFAQLEFTKNDMVMGVDAVQNGDVVAVTVRDGAGE